jgi:hypothetical protein
MDRRKLRLDPAVARSLADEPTTLVQAWQVAVTFLETAVLELELGEPPTPEWGALTAEERAAFLEGIAAAANWLRYGVEDIRADADDPSR